jgi:hypothetical protein
MAASTLQDKDDAASLRHQLKPNRITKDIEDGTNNESLAIQ